MTSLEPAERTFWRAAGVRGAMFLVLWLVLTAGKAADLAAGIVTAGLATWVSVHLLPPAPLRLSVLALATFALRFFRQSILAGVDVAWRALDPRLPLRTGFVVYPSHLPSGQARSAFCTLASLLPGTLPADQDQSGALVIHCLDMGQPVAAQLSEDEDLFRRALGGG
jgi:multicomponent Na+:H+ antiporter subunit E